MSKIKLIGGTCLLLSILFSLLFVEKPEEKTVVCEMYIKKCEKCGYEKMEGYYSYIDKCGYEECKSCGYYIEIDNN